jgi:CRP-like cAMP-binding protein
VTETSLLSFLEAIPLFEGCTPADLARIASVLASRTLQTGDVLMREGEQGRHFALIVSGSASVTRRGPDGEEQLALAGAGSLLGELTLLRGARRSASVTALVPTVVLTGGAGAFEALLDLPAVHDRVQHLVSARLAAGLRPVTVTLTDGGRAQLRPLLPSDRQRTVDSLEHMSRASLRNRFFRAGRPSERLIDYLLNIDYTDHFAWVMLDGDDIVGTGRYVRNPDHFEQAELAFEVVDSRQGRGVATILVGALGVAASLAGIDLLTASVLVDNAGGRAVLARAGASLTPLEAGVLAADMPVETVAGLLGPEHRAEVESAVRDIVTAAGLALTHHPTD